MLGLTDEIFFVVFITKDIFHAFLANECQTTELPSEQQFNFVIKPSVSLLMGSNKNAENCFQTYVFKVVLCTHSNKYSYIQGDD